MVKVNDTTACKCLSGNKVAFDKASGCSAVGNAWDKCASATVARVLTVRSSTSRGIDSSTGRRGALLENGAHKATHSGMQERPRQVRVHGVSTGRDLMTVEVVIAVHSGHESNGRVLQELAETRKCGGLSIVQPRGSVS